MDDDKDATAARLRDLAVMKGVELDYYDVRGQVHTASDQTLLALLQATGLAAGTWEEMDREILREERRAWEPLCPPVIVENLSHLPEELVFQIPVSSDPPIESVPPALQVQWALEEEGGYERLRILPPEEIRAGEFHRFPTGCFQRFAIPFPAGLPLGSHRCRLTVSTPEKSFTQELTLILCPDKAYKPPSLRGGGKRAGLMVSLAGLRSANNWGIGDLGDLRRLLRWAVDTLGVEVIGLLPLHALSNREPYNISPYYPSSRFYRNFVYLDVPAVEEVREAPEIGDWLGTEGVRSRITALREAPWVPFEAAAALKQEALEKAFRYFWNRRNDSEESARERWTGFQAFQRREGDFLERYAVFCALEEHFRSRPPFPATWWDWPPPFRDPESPEVRAFREDREERVLFYQYLQWLLEDQLQTVQQKAREWGAALGLYFDLALGIDPGGADAWAYQEFYLSGLKAGAPPDDFSPLGQDWGFRPSNRERHRQDGYRLLREEIRRNCPPGGALRIDHVMKYARLFWIPEGGKPADGAYVRDDFDDLVRVLALESVRNRTLIIGEDLGTVPDAVREVLNRHRIYSYRLFYFEKDAVGEFKSPEDYPRKALAAVSTHDLPTLAGYWSLRDIQVRKDLELFPDDREYHQARLARIQDKRRMIDALQRGGFLDEPTALRLQAQEIPEITPELHRAILGFLVTTSAKLVVLNQEDLFLEMDQQNLPGTTTQYPNWKRKMGVTLEELESDPRARELAGRYREWIERTGRVPENVEKME